MPQNVPASSAGHKPKPLDQVRDVIRRKHSACEPSGSTAIGFASSFCTIKRDIPGKPASACRSGGRGRRKFARSSRLAKIHDFSGLRCVEWLLRTRVRLPLTHVHSSAHACTSSAQAWTSRTQPWTSSAHRCASSAAACAPGRGTRRADSL